MGFKKQVLGILMDWWCSFVYLGWKLAKLMFHLLFKPSEVTCTILCNLENIN